MKKITFCLLFLISLFSFTLVVYFQCTPSKFDELDQIPHSELFISQAESEILDIKFTDGKFYKIKSFSSYYIVISNISESDFKVFLSSLNLEHQASKSNHAIQFDESALKCASEDLRNDYQNVFLSQDLLTFEGGNQYGIVSGGYSQEKKLIMFMLFYH